MTWLSQWHPLVYPQYTPEMTSNGTEEYNGTYASCNYNGSRNGEANTYSKVETIYWLGTDEETS